MKSWKRKGIKSIWKANNDTDKQIMNTDDTDNTEIRRNSLIYEDLTYKINGVIFNVHTELGPYAREKQYVDLAFTRLKEKGLIVEKEKPIGDSGNILDLIVEHKVILEFKAKRILTKEDYYQTQRYLQHTGLRLALLVNFRTKYVRPKRIVKIDNWKDKK